MMRFAALALAVVLPVAASARASDPTDAGQPLSLAQLPKVQKAIRLTDQEVAAVRGLKQEADAGSVGGEAIGRRLAAALPAAKLERLRQISYQVRGGARPRRRRGAAALGLSQEQARKIDAVWKNEELNLKMVLAVVRFRTAEVRRAYILRNRRESGDKLLALLDEDQKAAWTKMLGAAVDIKGLDR
ncbi:MAG: hypothetical protein U0736_16675 [Gemmataceae bacterium]